MSKRITSCLFLFFLFTFVNVSRVKAVCYGPYTGTLGTRTCDMYGCSQKCSYGSASDFGDCNCDWSSYTYCVKYSSGCSGGGPNVSQCCAQADRWKRYGSACKATASCKGYSCYNDIDGSFDGYSAVAVLDCNSYWSYEGTCSIGDKCVNGKVRPGYAACGDYGGEYKYCCTSDGVQHDCRGRNSDDWDPPEFSSCTAGSLKNDPCCPQIQGKCGDAVNHEGLPLNASSTNLCVTGNRVTNFKTNTYTYDWTCEGNDYTCTMWSTTDTNCSAVRNTPPRVSTTTINNHQGTNVPVDPLKVNYNHICQSNFNNNTNIQIVVTGDDDQGIGTIKSAQLRLGAYTYGPVIPANGVAVFSINLASINPGNYLIEANLTDDLNESSGWQNKSRYIKNWNCLVSISGTFYDNSSAGNANCSSNKTYITPIDSKYSFGLNYTSGPNSPRTMKVTAPTFTDNGQKLTWGSNYVPQFVNFPGVPPTDSKINNICQLDINLDTGLADAYTNSPSLQVNYGTIMSQDPWFQVKGGGVMAKTKVTNLIPITCSLDPSHCINTVSANNLSVGNSNAGLIAAPTVSCGASYSQCQFSQTTNWSAQVDLVKPVYDYDYFFQRYYLSLAQGVIIPTTGGTATLTQVNQISQGLGNTGVYFIPGNLDVNTSNPSALNQALVLIVKDTITVQPWVNQVNGILVAQNINVGGTSVNNAQLQFNGLLYAANSIQFSRNYTNQLVNNLSPPVIVNYSPSLIFNLPGKLAKVISSWKLGN